MEAARDQQATAFEAAEARLVEWGRTCRDTSDCLGFPRISGIRVMIEHVRREARLRKGVRKKSVRQVHKSWRKGEPTDAREVAEAFQYAEPGVTARGKQKPSFKKPGIVINSRILEVDAVVARLPAWMKVTILRSYLYGQPDRNACQDLRLPKEVYRLRRIAAVQYVADRLNE